LVEGQAQLLHRVDQVPDAEPGGELQRRRVDVVRALAHVHVLDRVQRRVVAARATQDLERPVGDHLVRVHVRRGARTALDDVDDELLVQRAAEDLLAGPLDRGAALRVEQPQRLVRLRRRLLDRGERPHEIGIDRDRRSGDREVLDRAQRVHAVIGVGGNLEFAEKIVFGTCGGIVHGDPNRTTVTSTDASVSAWNAWETPPDRYISCCGRSRLISLCAATSTSPSRHCTVIGPSTWCWGTVLPAGSTSRITSTWSSRTIAVDGTSSIASPSGGMSTISPEVACRNAMRRISVGSNAARNRGRAKRFRPQPGLPSSLGLVSTGQ